MPQGKDFVLYGPENDRTMGLRNKVAMWAARAMGRYASRTQYCEVLLVQVSRSPTALQIRRSNIVYRWMIFVVGIARVKLCLLSWIQTAVHTYIRMLMTPKCAGRGDARPAALLGAIPCHGED